MSPTMRSWATCHGVHIITLSYRSCAHVPEASWQIIPGQGADPNIGGTCSLASFCALDQVIVNGADPSIGGTCSLASVPLTRSVSMDCRRHQDAMAVGILMDGSASLPDQEALYDGREIPKKPVWFPL